MQALSWQGLLLRWQWVARICACRYGTRGQSSLTDDLYRPDASATELEPVPLEVSAGGQGDQLCRPPLILPAEMKGRASGRPVGLGRLRPEHALLERQMRPHLDATEARQLTPYGFCTRHHVSL